MSDLPHFIAIGASGDQGLKDIKDLLRALSVVPEAIVMVVLHRPSDRVSHLREVLARHTDMPVRVAAEGEILERGTCYVGEPAGHLTLVHTNLAHLEPGEGGRLRNRTIDALFKSLATHAGARTIGVILSGALDDGSRGLAAIRAARGFTMVLEPSDKPRGMQQNAIDFDGPIAFIGTAKQIAEVIRGVIAGVYVRNGAPVRDQ